MPSTCPTTSSSILVILKPGSSCSRWTLAVVCRSIGGWPASLIRFASDIVKQPACPAPISSSGFVAGTPSSTRARSVNVPSKAPLPTPIRPVPSATFPCQLACAIRTT